MNWLQHEEEVEHNGKQYTVVLDSDPEHYDWDDEVQVWEGDEWRTLTAKEVKMLARDPEWEAEMWRLHENYEIDKAEARGCDRFHAGRDEGRW